MRFKAWSDVSNTKSHIVTYTKIYQRWKLILLHVIGEWNPILYFGCGLKILLSSAVEPSTYVNHAVDETQTQNSLIPRGKNNRFVRTDLLGYVSGKEADDSQKFLKKVRSIIKSRANKRLTSIFYTRYMHNAEYIYKSSSCLEIFRVFVRGVMLKLSPTSSSTSFSPLVQCFWMVQHFFCVSSVSILYECDLASLGTQRNVMV